MTKEWEQALKDMPCVSKEEMQKCKEIVKKYTPQSCEEVSNLEEICEELAAENDMLREREKAILDYLKENADDFPDYHEAIEFIVGLRKGEQT